MNSIKKFLYTLMFISFIGVTTHNTAFASNLNEGPPVEFENAENIEQVIEEIDNYYMLDSNLNINEDEINFIAAAGTKWKNGEKVHDGKVGYYVTNYYWVKGNSMTQLNTVGNVQRNAVISKYGSVNKNTSYKMKTTQHITQTSSQTQGYRTISVKAWCYDRD